METTNLLTVPEIRNYRREEIEGVIVVTYDVRRPEATDWIPIRLVRLV